MYVIQWIEDQKDPRRWWHQIIGWCAHREAATHFNSRDEARAECRRSKIEGRSVIVVETK